MSLLGITLYYTDNNPSGGEPFFTENELIEDAQDFANNNDEAVTIETAADAMAYFESQGYGTFHETTQYIDEEDINDVDSSKRGQPITLVPYVRPSENERQQNLFKFLETYDDPRDFAKAFIVEEVKDTLDEDRHIYQNLDGVATFDSLNAEAKKSFALGHAYTLLNNFMDRPLEYLLESYDLHYINNWLTHVQIKE